MSRVAALDRIGGACLRCSAPGRAITCLAMAVQVRASNTVTRHTGVSRFFNGVDEFL